MPPAGVIAVAALAAISYVYIGHPIAHVAKHVGKGTCQVFTLGHRCKAKPKPPAPPTQLRIAVKESTR